jgi:decaprenylphospho-beta-D-erythro-pentofuranosid-2-ulose 2-reductase
MKVLILGATSAIAHETAKHFAAEGAELFLVGQSADKLNVVCDDLRVRGATRIETFAVNLNQLERHEEVIDTAIRALGGLDAALIAHGTLGDQQRAQADVPYMLAEFTTNAISYIALMTRLANIFEAQKRGCLAVISSVAGDRGRGSNYIYGAAKGTVSLFAQGLRNRLSKSGVAVVTIKPGFVDTPMTAHLKKNPLYAKPAPVGRRIYTAMLKGESVVYVPWFWRWIMLIIRNIPEAIFKKLSL